MDSRFFTKRMPHHSVSATNLTIQDFWELEIGEVMISPTGGLFTMGDPEVATEIFIDNPEKYEDVEGEVKEIEFEDIAGEKRRIIFVDGYAVGYDLLIMNGTVPMETTAVTFEEGEDDWNRFVSVERCIPPDETNT